jgi:dolichyl-diphosphooligosaccharide--protein glycosyltransferase
MDLHFLIFTFPAGVALYSCELRDEHFFGIVYFAGVMDRLMLTHTPVICIASAVLDTSSLIYPHPHPQQKGRRKRCCIQKRRFQAKRDTYLASMRVSWSSHVVFAVLFLFPLHIGHI